MNELNFSCDPPATRTVLTKGRNVSIMTGNNCLKVLFTKQEYRERFSGKENRAAAYIMEKQIIGSGIMMRITAFPDFITGM